jgi:hypothetical protein
MHRQLLSKEINIKVWTIALTLQGNKSLNGLQKYTNTQPQQKNTIEKGTEQLSPLPTKSKLLRRVTALGFLHFTSAPEPPHNRAHCTFKATRAITNPTKSFSCDVC